MNHRTAIYGGWLALALTLGLGLALAQPARAQDTPAAGQEAAKPVTVSGCVSQTENGQLQLAADNVVYLLSTTVEDLDLAAHVGHTVEVTGTPGSTDPEAGENAPKPFAVTALKMVKDHCGDGA